MRFIKIFFSILEIISIFYITILANKQEKNEIILRKKSEIVYAKILKVRCGKRGNIWFRYKGKEKTKRIYLSYDECIELRKKDKSGLKIDQDKNIIVFANDRYNDWYEAESVAILLLGTFFIFYIAYYGIITELKKTKKYIRTILNPQI